jgi:hypothetical protein
MVSCFRELRKKLYPALVLGCLLGSVTLAQNVQTSYLPGVDFSKYHTYKWVASQHQHPDPTVDAQIKQSLDTQLAARGLKKTDGTADLSIDYQTAISQQETWVVYEDWAAGAGAGWGANRLPQYKQVTIDVGTLVLDIYDTAAKELVWTGSASKTLDPKSSSKERQKSVDKAAKKLLANYPPK